MFQSTDDIDVAGEEIIEDQEHERNDPRNLISHDTADIPLRFHPPSIALESEPILEEEVGEEVASEFGNAISHSFQHLSFRHPGYLPTEEARRGSTATVELIDDHGEKSSHNGENGRADDARIEDNGHQNDLNEDTS